MPCFTRVTALASLQSLVLLQAPRRPGASLQERSNRVAKMKLAWGSSARLGTVVILGAGLGSLLGGCSRSNGQTAAAAPPPPEVGVVTVAPARADLST